MIVHGEWLLGLPSPGQAIGGVVSAGASAVAVPVLDAISSFVLAGAAAALRATAHLISATTTPHLLAPWFSASYWRVAGLSALLTVPFLFAAAIQALLRSDITMLGRAALVDLPLAGLAVTVAAPLATLLLTATDQMCGVVSGGAATGGGRFLVQAAGAAAAGSAVDGSMFIALFVGLMTVVAAICLTVELLVRDAAVYVIVLMLPLAFAALVWPARRIWAVRMVELLLALIFAKFVIVAVLSLAAAALGQENSGLSVLLPAMTLVILSTFAPWALLRILPFAEVAAAAHSAVRAGVSEPVAHDRRVRKWLGEDGDGMPARDGGSGAEGTAGPNLPRSMESASGGGRSGGRSETGHEPSGEPSAGPHR